MECENLTFEATKINKCIGLVQKPQRLMSQGKTKQNKKYYTFLFRSKHHNCNKYSNGGVISGCLSLDFETNQTLALQTAGMKLWAFNGQGGSNKSLTDSTMMTCLKHGAFIFTVYVYNVWKWSLVVMNLSPESAAPLGFMKLSSHFQIIV